MPSKYRPNNCQNESSWSDLFVDDEDIDLPKILWWFITSFCPVAWLRNWKKPNLHKPAKEQDKREHKIPVIKHIGPNNMNKTDLVAPIYDRQQTGPIVAYFRTKTAPTCLRRI